MFMPGIELFISDMPCELAGWWSIPHGDKHAYGYTSDEERTKKR
ncbi:hypothetical protein [Deinococcus wulumuqiensis]|nr:hypothetical protein [Deinococcus wulumuqiensis]